MPPRVRLGRTHGRSNTPRHEIQAGADLSPSQPALRRSRKFTALTEFCKRLTELSDMASAPTTGLRRRPKGGYRTPECLLTPSPCAGDRVCVLPGPPARPRPP